MWNNEVLSSLRLILSMLVICAVKGVKYEFLIDDEEIFNTCPNQRPGVLGSHGLFDLSEFKTVITDDVLTLGGNLTAVWDMDHTDFVSFQITMYQNDRGIWRPTIYSINVKDFCSVMYNKNFYWYTYWTQYVINKEEVENRCFMRGTKLLFEEYPLHLVLNIGNAKFSGLYKAQYLIEAYSRIGIRRPISFCFEVRAEFRKVK
ncbi:uncharacterized protein DMAD_10452 [Drosophila madeirensis]|uniref:Uncharacterized protein n=1 Tax=Drosophila madeirensis TaxID=30013 RepID=A0AAU9F9Q6_DROMD